MADSFSINSGNIVSGVTASISGTAATSVIAAQPASQRIYVTSLLVTNGDDETGTFVNITDGSGGAVIWSGWAEKAGGGFSHNFKTPIVTSAATALYCSCVTTGALVRVCAAGYRGPA
jgi:hypothetical protein